MSGNLRSWLLRPCAAPWWIGAFLLPLAVEAPVAAAAEPPSAEDVLARAVRFHDPEGRWATGAFRLTLEESRPDGGARQTVATIDNQRGSFAIRTIAGDVPVAGSLEGTACSLVIAGAPDPPAALQEAHRWSCERLRRVRDYYTYLWGLPMKLRDPGTPIDPDAREVELDGQRLWALRVAYLPPVGSDVWTFYLDPESGALRAYRFHHDEAAGDGELIRLEGLVEGAGLRLPQRRSWETNAEGRYLGTDTLVDLAALD